MTANAALEEELGTLIRTSAPDIVRNVIAKAREGSYLHAKFLFELAGIDLTQTAQPDDGEESLSAYLLRELKDPKRDSTPG
jgi:hypothetical protein